MSRNRIEIDVKNQVARVVEGSVIKYRYPISTAQNGVGCEVDSFKTPHGKLRIYQKIGENYKEGSVFKARVPTGEVCSLGHPLWQSPEDLVLSRILWLEGAEPHNSNTLDRYIYLHGTNQEYLIGNPASHGCIRMLNADIIELFEKVDVGDLVEVCE